MALVAPEAPSEQARRVFQTYDPEGKGCTSFWSENFGSKCAHSLDTNFEL